MWEVMTDDNMGIAITIVKQGRRQQDITSLKDASLSSSAFSMTTRNPFMWPCFPGAEVVLKI